MDWQKIVVHHSASPTSVKRGKTSVPVDTAMIRQWHLAKGWSDIGYHFVILPDGRCEEGRPLYRPGAHCVAGHRNFIGIGICLVGNFSQADEIPETQLNGLVTKVISLMQDHHLDIGDVELHREIPGAATECPGRFFPEDLFRRVLKERLG
ncbi:MAG: N-acetylmuramoyl-L-alanine amidase [Desulfitobacterium sp.]